MERLVNRGSPISVYEYWQLNKRKWEAQKSYLDRWNASTGLTKSGKMVDLLLTPVMPHVAVPHRGCGWVGYTKVWNVIDYTAGVVPNVGFVDREVDKKEQYETRNDMDRWNWEMCMFHSPNYHRCELILGVQMILSRCMDILLDCRS